MPTVEVIEIGVLSPELGAAAALFDRYRSVYGKPTNPSLAHHYLRERSRGFVGYSMCLCPT